MAPVDYLRAVASVGAMTVADLTKMAVRA